MIRFRGVELSPDFRIRSEREMKAAQDHIDKECIRLMEDYTPVAMPKYRNHGKMSRSHRQESPGVIVNTEPKARREYYTNKGFSGGKRGKLWLERMKADHKAEILKGLKK